MSWNKTEPIMYLLSRILNLMIHNLISNWLEIYLFFEDGKAVG
jgi:hypothetical protein